MKFSISSQEFDVATNREMHFSVNRSAFHRVELSS